MFLAYGHQYPLKFSVVFFTSPLIWFDWKAVTFKPVLGLFKLFGAGCFLFLRLFVSVYCLFDVVCLILPPFHDSYLKRRVVNVLGCVSGHSCSLLLNSTRSKGSCGPNMHIVGSC